MPSLWHQIPYRSASCLFWRNIFSVPFLLSLRHLELLLRPLSVCFEMANGQRIPKMTLKAIFWTSTCGNEARYVADTLDLHYSIHVKPEWLVIYCIYLELIVLWTLILRAVLTVTRSSKLRFSCRSLCSVTRDRCRKIQIFVALRYSLLYSSGR